MALAYPAGGLTIESGGAILVAFPSSLAVNVIQ